MDFIKKAPSFGSMFHTAFVGIDLGMNECKVSFVIESMPVRETHSSDNGTDFSMTLASADCFAVTAFFRRRLNGREYFIGRNTITNEISDYSVNHVDRNVTPDFEIVVGKYYGEIHVAKKHLLALLFREIFHTISDLYMQQSSNKITSFRASVTIPSWLNNTQQELIFEAAFLAGFASIGLLPDYIASALAYKKLFPLDDTVNRVMSLQELVLFVDLAQNSTTVSTISLGSHDIIFGYKSSNPSVGGDTVNKALALYLQEEILATHPWIGSLSSSLHNALLDECHQVKEELMHSHKAELRLSNHNLNLDYKISVTREILHLASASVADNLLWIIADTLDKAGINKQELDTIVCLGPFGPLYKSQIVASLLYPTSKSLSSPYILSASSLASSMLIPQHTIDTSKKWIAQPSVVNFSWCKWTLDTHSNSDGDNLISDLDSLKFSWDSLEPQPRVSPAIQENPVSSVISPVSPAQTNTSTIAIDDEIKRLTINLDKAKNHDGISDIQNNLGTLYMQKYDITKQPTQLGSAIVWIAKALGDADYGMCEKPEFLSNLNCCLLKQYEIQQDIGILNAAILYQSYIIRDLDDNNPKAAGYLNNYGIFLQTRGITLGHTPDLVESGKYIQSAIGIFTKSPDPSTWNVKGLTDAISNLGNTLQHLYNWTGRLSDLHNMIKCYECALSINKESNTERASSLHSCGSALILHYKHLGDVNDINTAIQYFEEAIQCVSNGPQKALYLSGYVNALEALYQESDDVETINTAIEMHYKISSLATENHHDQSAMLNKLGVLLSQRFDATRNINDLYEALKNHQKAIDLTQENNFTKKFTFMNNLGNALVKISKEQNSFEHLKQAIKVFEEAIDYIDNGSNRSKAVFNLADTYFDCFVSQRDHEDLEKCISLCKEVVDSLTPLTVRFQAGKLWTEATSWSTNGPDTQEATTTMMDLLSQLAWPGLSLASQINVLKVARQTACNAASIALHYKDVARALEWLEQGRTVAWNQILHIRSPLEDLKMKDSHLADQIIRLSNEIENGGRDEADTSSRLHVEKSKTFSKNAIALERDLLLEKARKMPGFERLMMSKDYTEFGIASYDGPAIVINVSKHRCDAIIITAHSMPVNLPLTEFSLEQAEELRRLMHEVLQNSAKLQRSVPATIYNDADSMDRFGKSKRAKQNEAIDGIFRHILKELYLKVVSPIMNCLGIGIALPEDMPHVWWCPTGPLTFLPLHAAGIYAADGDHETARISALDYIVSSYIPSLSSLHNIMYKKHDRPAFKFLSVIQPNTPSHPELPATIYELKVIESHAAEAGLADFLEVLKNEKATCKQVMESMNEYSWVHLACHGQQDINYPTNSGLHLHDGTLSVETIVKKTLPNADFAFLSACQTASGDMGHPDEAVHLAASMLMAGYNSVIASMWSIGDDDAARVAGNVYGHLFKEGNSPDSRKAARALHAAVQDLRTHHTGRHGGSKFLAWLPYTHYGM